jgi:hypothetical protein
VLRRCSISSILRLAERLGRRMGETSGPARGAHENRSGSCGGRFIERNGCRFRWPGLGRRSDPRQVHGDAKWPYCARNGGRNSAHDVDRQSVRVRLRAGDRRQRRDVGCAARGRSVDRICEKAGRCRLQERDGGPWHISAFAGCSNAQGHSYQHLRGAGLR